MKRLIDIEVFVLGAAVICLIVAGVRLTTIRLTLGKDSAQRTNTASYTQYLQLEAGIDIWGKVVHALPATVEDRGLIFLLRSSSLDADIKFWREAAKLAEKYPSLRLVAYCDGQDCAKRLVEANQVLPFPVISFGEIAGTEALFQNDRDGNAIVRSERWFTPRSVEWRAAGSAPEKVIDGAMK
jgi:hypothetical protein